MLPFEEWVSGEDIVEYGCHFFVSLVAYFNLKKQDLLFFPPPMPFLPNFGKTPLDLFPLNFLRFVLFFNEMRHSANYSTLRSYTAEIPGGKIDKRKVTSLKEPEQLVFVYYDRCTHVHFFQ